MASFQGQVALVTGASTGIGRATAKALRAAGARVALAARSTAALEELATALGGPDWALAIPGDVTDPAQCRAMVERTVAHFGQLDILINNAGMIVSGRFEHLQPGDMEQQFAVNFHGVVYCTQAALPHLKASRGVIVNVSSVAGFFGLFNAVSSLIAVLIQLVGAGWFLRVLSLQANLSILPGALGLCGALGVLRPGFGIAMAVRFLQRSMIRVMHTPACRVLVSPIPPRYIPGARSLAYRVALSLGFIGRNGAYPANEAGRRADLVIAIGARFDDRSASSWLPGYSWNFPHSKLIHVDLDPDEI
ncbi:MAG: SDR family NAD(P)-dependent oxidoreductase, partial [Caldilineales bacterium]|nr:SDR family NAD(P)-dependent oxidoreductase [Caldilineales bacterium]